MIREGCKPSPTGHGGICPAGQIPVEKGEKMLYNGENPMEEGSPYEKTLFIGYANHHIGYLPSEFTYTYTSYETDITRFVQGTDGQVIETYLEMLNTLKDQ